MRKIVVSLSEGRSYPVFVGKMLFGEKGWKDCVFFPSKRGVLITNTTLDALHTDKLVSSFEQEKFTLGKVVIPDGEAHKNLTTVEAIYHELIRFDIDRRNFLLSFGGGVVTDITGFVASTFLRGIDYFQIPTSLLAQVDSSIGGKTGVNLQEGKNLVGTFYQPRGVFIDLSFLETLPEREYREGLSEILKVAFLSGGDFLEFVEKYREAIKRRDWEVLEELVILAVDFKRRIVEEDERDRGLRSILNYGHTVGHALEKALGYGVIRHGEAVAIGMVGEAFLAWKLGMSNEKIFKQQRAILQSFGLPVSLEYPLDRLTCVSALCRDKKKEEGQIRFVFLKDFGSPQWGVEVNENDLEWVLSFLEKREE
ncbi:MAG: 3-dehydroquinate synthase [Atribacterota bacterium]